MAALLDGPLHGCGIAARAAELSGGRVRLTAGTLYGALERLQREGLVAVEREETVRGRRRRERPPHLHPYCPGGLMSDALPLIAVLSAVALAAAVILVPIRRAARLARSN